MSSPRVGVGCIVRREAEVLLLRRRGSHGDGTWSSQGGDLDFGEDPAVCAARETEEETGLGWFRMDPLSEPLFPPLRRVLEGDLLR